MFMFLSKDSRLTPAFAKGYGVASSRLYSLRDRHRKRNRRRVSVSLQKFSQKARREAKERAQLCKFFAVFACSRTLSELPSVKVSADKFVNARRVHQVAAATAPRMPPWNHLTSFVRPRI
jgi:hypothetical protein